MMISLSELNRRAAEMAEDLKGIVDKERCRQALVKCGGNAVRAKEYLKNQGKVITNRDMVKKKGKH